MPTTGTCSFRFSLFEDAGGTSQVGSTDTLVGVAVTDGLFTVQLDFGTGAFADAARWLGIEVQCPGDPGYTNLGLQSLTAVPSALYAVETSWDGISGVPTGLADGTDDVEAAKVVTVAKSGGDFTGVQAALNSITDASSSNPYLVRVAPGSYSGTVVMKAHVHLQGSGAGATVLTSTSCGSAFPPAAATLKLSSNTTLRDLTIVNSGTGSTCIALMAPPGVTNATVRDVRAQATGNATENYAVHVMAVGGGDIELELDSVSALAANATSLNVGLRNYYHSTLTLRGGSYRGHGGDSAHGISNGADETILIAENVIAEAENGDVNYGLTNGEGIASLLGGAFSAIGGETTKGIYSYTYSYLEAEGVIAIGQNGTSDNCGLENATAQAMLYGGSYSAFGGTATRGIHNRASSAVLEAVGVAALGQDSSSLNYGLYNEDEAEATLHGGSFSGRSGTSTYGIRNRDAHTSLATYDATALGEQGSIGNRGLYNDDEALAVLHGGSFIAHDGGSGILNHEADVEAYDVFALGEGPTYSYNQGLSHTANAPATASAVLRGGTFMARGATYEARGIFTWGDNTTLVASGVTLLAEDGDESYGIMINSGTASITQSTIEGSDYAVYRNTTGGSVITVTNSRIEDDCFGTVSCVAVTAGTTFYENTCP